MKRFVPALFSPAFAPLCVMMMILLSFHACSPVTGTESAIETTTQPTSPAALHSTAPLSQTEESKSTSTPEAPVLPFSGSGPYYVSRRRFTFFDPNRDNRKVSITVWYPAVRPEDGTDLPIAVRSDLDPDLSGAPYPLLISSTEMANTLAAYLVSHGFSWASVNGIHSYEKMHEQMYSQPLDILFALDSAALGPLEGLEGMIDASHTGVIGYSFDGYNTLAQSGARVDPEFYLTLCENPDLVVNEILETALSAFSCEPALDWDAFSAKVAESITSSEDGLWQPMTDERIRAVMPMAAEGWWLFGERGLAAIDLPTLILIGTQDELYPQNALIFEHIGTPDKALISFVDLNHMMVFKKESIARMAHFVTAFFGYHLQGREDYAQYYSEDFVAQFDDLAWGVVKP